MDSSKQAHTILVTGGAGFIGSNLVRLLLAETASTVINLDALTYAGNRASISDLDTEERHTFVEGSINDASLLRHLLETHQPDAIINLAAETHVDRSIDDSRPFIQSNVVGPHVLLEAVRSWWHALPTEQAASFRLLHVSTDEVYGSIPSGTFASELTCHAPSSPYSATKSAAEALVQAWHVTYGLPTLITRCSNNYGPFQFPEKLIPVMIGRATAGRSLPIYGDGEQIRDWIHVEDHCRALLQVLDAGLVGTAYNLGTGEDTSNRMLVEQICSVLDQSRPHLARHAELIQFVADRPGHDRRYAIDCTRARSELGWSPRIDLEEGMRRTVAWYVRNDTWCEDVARAHAPLRRRGTAPSRQHVPSSGQSS